MAVLIDIIIYVITINSNYYFLLINNLLLLFIILLRVVLAIKSVQIKVYNRIYNHTHVLEGSNMKTRRVKILSTIFIKYDFHKSLQ